MLPDLTQSLAAEQLDQLRLAPRAEVVALARQLKREVDQQIQKDLPATERLVGLLETLANALGYPEVNALAARSRAQLHHVQGNFAEARALYRRAIACHERLGERVEAARTRKTLMDVLMYLGRLDEAARMAARARAELAGSNDERLLAQLDTHEANLLFRREEWARAVTLYRAAQRRFRRLKDAYGLAHVAFNLANCESCLDRVPRARRLYQVARARYQRLQLGRMVADTDYGLGYLDFLAGKLGPAIARLLQAGEQFAAQQHPLGVALVELDLSEVMLCLNDAPRALRHAKRGALAFKQLGLRLEEARTRLYAGSALLSSGDLSSAAGSLRRARELILAEQSRVRLTELALEQANLSRMAGAIGTAAEAYRHAAASYRELGLPRREGRALVLAASALRQLGSHESRDCAELALAIARQVADLRLLAVAFEELAACPDERPHRSQRRLFAAFAALERVAPLMPTLFASGSLCDDVMRVVDKLVATDLPAEQRIALIGRAHALPLALMRGLSLGKDDARGEALKEELRWLYQRLYLDRRSHVVGSSPAPRSGELEHLQQRTLELEHSVERRQLTRRVARSRRPVESVAELGRVLGPREILVEYFPCGERWSAALITQDRRAFVPLSATLSATHALVQSLHLELAHAARAQPSTPSRERVRATRDLLGALYDHLLAPLEREIAGREVLLSPHGHLWLVPFAAACFARGNSLESLAHVTSLEDLRLARQASAERTHRAAVLGGTDQDLPSAREEVMLVRSELERAGMRVAEESLHERPAIDLLHIAGHGIRRDDNPHFAAIRATDGFLSATDISELDLSQVQLVVLSGCETGRGSLETGRELGGLALSFLGAGARAVVSSLWPVADRETEQLMRVFYRQLGRGMPPARALAIAQAELARSLGDGGHPYFFGAFRIVGDGATPLVSQADPALTR